MKLRMALTLFLLLLQWQTRLQCFDKTPLPASKNITDLGGVKSGLHFRDILSGDADFLVSDLPVDKTEAAEILHKRGVRLINLPTAISATVPAYNISGVRTGLKFPPEVLAGIFLGKITRWNDALIVKANPGVGLPGAAIVLIQRTDESGCTASWTEYLSRTSPDWVAAIGRTRSLTLPVPLKAESAEASAALVNHTQNSIGFVELWAAKKYGLRLGQVRNVAGVYVEATAASMYAAAESTLPMLLKDFERPLADAPSPKAYPICNFMWMVVPESIADSRKKQRIVSFIRFVLGEGQKESEGVSYGHLPGELIAAELKLVGIIH